MKSKKEHDMNKTFAIGLCKKLLSEGVYAMPKRDLYYENFYSVYVSGVRMSDDTRCRWLEANYGLHAYDEFFTNDRKYSDGIACYQKNVIDANTGEVLSSRDIDRRVCRGWMMSRENGQTYIHNKKTNTEAGQGMLALLIVLAVFLAAFIFISGGL